MGLSAHRTYETLGPQTRIPGKLDDDETFYKGAILVIDADGYLAKPTDAAELTGAGIWTGHNLTPGEDSYVTAESAHPDSEVMRGKVWLPADAVVQGDAGVKWYIEDDEEMTKTAGDRTIYYRPIAVDATNNLVLVDLDDPNEDTISAD